MNISVIIDVAILAVVLAFAVLGWKRGLLRTLTELMSVALALFLAAQISTYAAHFVVDEILRPATEKAVEQQATLVANQASRTAKEKINGVLEGIPSSFIREHAQTLLERSSVQEQVGAAGRDALLAASLRLTNNVLDTVVYNLVHSLLYAASFAILNFALRMTLKALKKAVKLPVLKQLNQTGGMLLGVAKGVALSCLCVWALSGIGVLTEEMTGGSILVGLAGSLPGKLLFLG